MWLDRRSGECYNLKCYAPGLAAGFRNIVSHYSSSGLLEQQANRLQVVDYSSHLCRGALVWLLYTHQIGCHGWRGDRLQGGHGIERKGLTKAVEQEFLPALEHQHINEQIYELLLSRILSQQFAPGQRLQVDEIAAALRVSRTPVKDAINRLAVEGLVVVAPRKGTFVADVTPEGIKDLFDVRMMIELHAAELAVVRGTDRDIADLEDLVSSLQGFVDGDHYVDYEAYLGLDNEFHIRMLQMAGNTLLTKLYRDINLHVQVVRAYQKAPGVASEALPSYNEHSAILSAFKARNVTALRAAVTTHVQNRGNQFIRALELSKNQGPEVQPIST
jgi:GntR family transcriptional regulator, rspAB operon transcriptional repressor